MAEYIEKSKANDVLIHITALEGSELEEAVNAICSIPAADVAQVRHGRWVVKGDTQPISNDKVYGCSLCDDKNRRYYEWQLSNYCPNCGADMREETRCTKKRLRNCEIMHPLARVKLRS